MTLNPTPAEYAQRLQEGIDAIQQDPDTLLTALARVTQTREELRDLIGRDNVPAAFKQGDAYRRIAEKEGNKAWPSMGKIVDKSTFVRYLRIHMTNAAYANLESSTASSSDEGLQLIQADSDITLENLSD